MRVLAPEARTEARIARGRKGPQGRADARMPSASALGLLSALALAISPTSARADAVEIPMSCPESSANGFCHGPATCAPRGCVSPSDCMPGEVCAARTLCIETHECFGFPSSFVDHVLGPCGPGEACASPASCESIFVCAPGTTPLDAGTDGGVVPEHVTACACRAGARGTGGHLALFTALGLAVALARRRLGRHPL